MRAVVSGRLKAVELVCNALERRGRRIGLRQSIRSRTVLQHAWMHNVICSLFYDYTRAHKRPPGSRRPRWRNAVIVVIETLVSCSATVLPADDHQNPCRWRRHWLAAGRGRRRIQRNTPQDRPKIYGEGVAEMSGDTWQSLLNAIPCLCCTHRI